MYALWCLPIWAKFMIGSVVGLLISAGAGHWCVPCFDRYAGKWLRAPGDEAWEQAQRWDRWERTRRVPSELTGLVERLAFTFFVIAYPGVAVAGMFGWLGLKMAANWNKDVLPKDGDDAVRARIAWNRFAFLGLLTGFVSMCFAWVGGIVARLITGLPVGS